MKPALYAIAIIAGWLVPLGFWLGGYNFDEWGSWAVTVYLLTLVAAGYAFAWGKLK
jgi:hypothetical protein